MGDTSSVELRHLRYFITVAEELHFGRAAERLFISQPPLSRQIRDFENELGVSLFTRNGKRIGLTPAGEYLKAEGEKLLKSAANLQRQVRLLGGVDQAGVSLGYVGSMVFSIIPSLLAHVKRAHPGWTIDISESSTEEQIGAITEGRIDVGLTRSWGGNDLLEFLPLGSEKLTLIFPADQRLEGGEADILEQFAERPYIGINKERAPGLASLVEAVCERAGFRPMVTVETAQVYSVIKLVSEGMGWSILPTYLRLERFPEAIRTVELPASIPFCLCYRKDQTIPKVQEIVRLTREFFAS